MNKTQLLSEIATDLEIEKFKNETDESHTIRVLYSALGQWIQTSVFDKNVISDSLTENCRTLQYIVQKCRSILTSYTMLYPEIKEWFYPKSTSNPIRTMYLRYIAAGQLLPSYGNTYQLPEPLYSKVTPDLFYVRGVPADGHQNTCHYGLGTFVSSVPEGAATADINALFRIPSTSAYKFAREFIEMAAPKLEINETTLESREYFDVRSKKSFSQSWQNNPNRDWKYSVYRNNKFSDYGLVKCDGEKLMTYKFPEYMTETFETKRLLYGLREIGLKEIGKTQYGYVTESTGEFVKITLYSTLPKPEETLMHLISWPSRNIEDCAEFITSKKLLPIVRRLLSNLNLACWKDVS